jgi:hypothetical protein
MIMLNKDEHGALIIGSIYDTKPGTRADTIFDKEYISGAFGGVPKQLSLDFDREEES